jgi:hypothetical protein
MLARPRGGGLFAPRLFLLRKPRGSADAAVPAVALENQVALNPRMPMLAMGARSVCPPGVLSTGDGLEMRRIYTASVATKMVYVETVWNFADKMRVCEPKAATLKPVCVELRIAEACDRACPHPAWG